MQSFFSFSPFLLAHFLYLVDYVRYLRNYLEGLLSIVYDSNLIIDENKPSIISLPTVAPMQQKRFENVAFYNEDNIKLRV